MRTSSPRLRLGAWIAAGVLGGGLVTGIALGAIGTATAASPSPSPMQRFGERLRGLPLLGGPGGKVLHSEATVQKANGTTAVVVSQSGDITNVTTSTITVKSSDGYQATYAIDKNTRISLNGTDGTASSLKSGDSVRVVGTKSGTTTHAEAVMDGMPTGFMMFRPGQRGAPAPSSELGNSST